MSPELFASDPGIDNRRTKSSDCYALGMVIYEVLRGRIPFHQYTWCSAIARIIKGGRPERPPDEEGKWFTDGVWRVVECCWKCEPGDRPNIDYVLRFLEETSNSGFWTSLHPSTAEGPQEDSPAPTITDVVTKKPWMT